jgi:hypothetical protein
LLTRPRLSSRGAPPGNDVDLIDSGTARIDGAELKQSGHMARSYPTPRPDRRTLAPIELQGQDSFDSRDYIGSHQSEKDVSATFWVDELLSMKSRQKMLRPARRSGRRPARLPVRVEPRW